MISLSDPILQTIVALLWAHVIADFILQFNWMVENKRKPEVLLLHAGVVFVVTGLAVGGGWYPAFIVTLAHLIIDGVKAWFVPRNNKEALAFFVDQIAHILTILLAANYFPDSFASGWWAPWTDDVLKPAILITGFLIVVCVGGYAVGVITSTYASEFSGDGLPNAGKVIGQLERTLIFFLIMINQPEGIGFLIAAKSVLRFEASKEQKASEYLIIGTLSSFGWALVFSVAASKAISL